MRTPAKPAALYGDGAPRPSPRKKREKVSELENARLLSQLALTLEAGLPLLEAMHLLLDAAPETRRRLLQRMREDITAGSGLAQSMAAQTGHFDPVCRRLVEAGERNGALPTCLRHAADYAHGRWHRRRRLRRALFYPALVAAAALATAALLLLKVVPQFELIFSEFGAELPMLTRAIIAISNGLREHIATLVLAASAVVALIAMPAAAAWRSRALAATPLIGPWLKSEALERFCSIATLSLSAKLPLPEALRLAGGAGGAPMAEAGERALKRLIAGDGVAAAFGKEKIFPPLLIRMMAVGERTGRLAELFDTLARQYRETAAERAERASAALEPISIALLGVLIGALILAMYLPIFELGNAL